MEMKQMISKENNNLYQSPKEELQFSQEEFAIYVVLTQTGSWLSGLLKRVTRASYNHASLSLDRNLHQMYSFGRRHPYNPVWGGFVMESKDEGTFKRFSNTDAVVLEKIVKKEQYLQIQKYLEDMYLQRKRYGYNFTGVVLAGLNIHYKPENKYYCSEFIRETLIHFNVIDENQFSEIIKPIDLLELSDSRIVYMGKLNLYQM